MRVLVLAILTTLALSPNTALAQQAAAPPAKLTPSAPPARVVPRRTDAFGVALVFDAFTQKGPCALTQKEYDSMAGSETALTDQVASRCRTLPFEDGAGYRLIVLHPRFKATYDVTVTAQTDLGSGVLEPRGLADVTPIDLSKIGTPVAHGGRMPSTLSIPAVTPAQVLELLLDPTRVSSLRVMIDGQVRDLTDGADALDRELKRLSADVDSVIGDRSSKKAECTPTSGGPTVDGLIACVDAIGKRIVHNTRKGSVVPPTAACGGAAIGWSAAEFDCVVNDIDVRIGHLALIRTRLSEFNLLVAADKLDTEAVILRTKIGAFQTNLETILGTLTDLQAVVNIKAASTAARGVLREARQILVKKQLKARYGDVMTEAQLNNLAVSAVNAMTNEQIVEATAQQIGKLTNDLEFDPSAKDDSKNLPIKVKTLRGRTDAVRSNLAPITQHVAARTADLNTKFATMLADIDNVYLTVADREMKYIELRTEEKQGTNRIIYAKLTSNEKFRLYVFTGAVQALPAPAAGSLPLLSVAPSPTFGATLANLPQNIEKTFSIELHRLWRANIVGGIVFSSLAGTDFAIGTKIVDGNVVRIPIVANEQTPSAHYLVGFNYYFVPADSFPGAKQGAKRWIPGALLGLGLESSKHFFFGLNFEPTLGVDLSAGWHWGEQTALQPGYAAGETVLPDAISTVPTRTVMRSGVYFMIGFDLNIFRRFMGTVAPQ